MSDNQDDNLNIKGSFNDVLRASVKKSRVIQSMDIKYLGIDYLVEVDAEKSLWVTNKNTNERVNHSLEKMKELNDSELEKKAKKVIDNSDLLKNK